MSNISKHPCPICKTDMVVMGKDSKGRKITSCGHTFRFKKTRSQKLNDRKYIRTEYGLERIQ